MYMYIFVQRGKMAVVSASIQEFLLNEIVNTMQAAPQGDNEAGMGNMKSSREGCIE